MEGQKIKKYFSQHRNDIIPSILIKKKLLSLLENKDQKSLKDILLNLERERQLKNNNLWNYFLLRYKAKDQKVYALFRKIFFILLYITQTIESLKAGGKQKKYQQKLKYFKNLPEDLEKKDSSNQKKYKKARDQFNFPQTAQKSQVSASNPQSTNIRDLTELKSIAKYIYLNNIKLVTLFKWFMYTKKIEIQKLLELKVLHTFFPNPYAIPKEKLRFIKRSIFEIVKGLYSLFLTFKEEINSISWETPEDQFLININKIFQKIMKHKPFLELSEDWTKENKIQFLENIVFYALLDIESKIMLETQVHDEIKTIHKWWQTFSNLFDSKKKESFWEKLKKFEENILERVQ